MFIVLEVLKIRDQYFLPVPVADCIYSRPSCPTVCHVNDYNTCLNCVSVKATILELQVKDSGLVRLLLCGP
jgi:hypothetical protein